MRINSDRTALALAFRRGAEKKTSMSKTNGHLEKRLARVEKELAQLREVVLYWFSENRNFAFESVARV
jgi:hypothetical protein